MPSLVHFYNFFEQQFYLLTVYRYFCLVFRISKLFHNYIKYNFHVGLAVLALVQITISDFDLPFHFSHQFIFFLAPFLAYNFIKFHRFLWKEIDSIIKLLLFLIGFSAFGIFLFEGLGFYLPVSSWIILFFTLCWYYYIVCLYRDLD